MVREFLLLQKKSLQHLTLSNPDLHVFLMPCTRIGLLISVGNLGLAWKLLFPAGYPALYSRTRIACINLFLSFCIYMTNILNLAVSSLQAIVLPL